MWAMSGSCFQFASSTRVRSPLVARKVHARHGHGSASPIPKGYLGDLRKAAISLHTREQLGNKKAQKEAEQAKERPAFKPTVNGYVTFLQESKAVFDCLEEIVAESDDPSLALFKQTGLERGPALARDLRWFADEKGVELPPGGADGPGVIYAEHLRSLAQNDVPAFMCHYYNVYFAHTAGGRMIGKSVSNAILDGAELDFYKYDGDVGELGDKVKADLETVAQTWTDEERKHSVAETKATFQYSGTLLQCITQP